MGNILKLASNWNYYIINKHQSKGNKLKTISVFVDGIINSINIIKLIETWDCRDWEWH